MASNYTMEIKFIDNDEAVFYPGQTVKGLDRKCVDIKLKEHTKCFSLKVNSSSPYHQPH